MKQGELEKKIKAIGTKLSRSKLIDNCLQVMRVHGKYATDMHSDRTDVDAGYSDDVVIMSYSASGYGAGNLRVSSEGQIVLHTKDRGADDTDEHGIPYPKAGSDRVHEYHPGDWEEHVKVLAKLTREQLYAKLNPEPPKEEEIPPGEGEVSDGVLRGIERNFPGLLDN